mmetsp:Transcript_22258/g.48123  ORF Transcript_22258/g.48123 Transcript_22258/m.48123 type:complete len:122 (-) Transcript_22258:810-1175(-)
MLTSDRLDNSPLKSASTASSLLPSPRRTDSMEWLKASTSSSVHLDPEGREGVEAFARGRRWGGELTVPHRRGDDDSEATLGDPGGDVGQPCALLLVLAKRDGPESTGSLPDPGEGIPAVTG